MAQVPSSLSLLFAIVQLKSTSDRMFNQQEVQILIGGVNSLIDLDDLRRHTNYGGLYDDKAENIVDFWNVCSHSADVILLLALMFYAGCQYFRSRSTSRIAKIRYQLQSAPTSVGRCCLCSRPSTYPHAHDILADSKNSFLILALGMLAPTHSVCPLQALVLIC